MATLNPSFEGLAKSVRHHATRYRLEQPRLAALAPYPDVASLAKALAPDSPLDKEIRATIVLALVELQGAAPHPLWSSLLALAFAPMLRRLRKRIGRPRDEDLDQKLNDTWVWDGTSWASVTTPTAPPARFHAGMTAFQNQIVLFGGAGAIPNGEPFLSDTWVWSPSTSSWTQATSTGPSGRYAYTLAAY